MLTARELPVDVDYVPSEVILIQDQTIPVLEYDQGGYAVFLKITVKPKKGSVFTPKNNPDHMFDTYYVLPDEQPATIINHVVVFTDHNDWKKHESEEYRQIYSLCLETIHHDVESIIKITTKKALGYRDQRPYTQSVKDNGRAPAIPPFQIPSNKRLPISNLQGSPLKTNRASQ